MNNYNSIPTKELLDIILQDRKQSDEIMYFILKERIYDKLKDKYEVHERVLFDSFDELVDDFFLYLREGCGNPSLPYYVLHTIKKKEAIESWLVGTFRNYLTNRSKIEEQSYTLKEQQIAEDEEGSIDKEQLISNAAQLIAYSHQTLFPRNQFIFLRMLLSLLDKSNALPDIEMAKAMGMSHTLYRVTCHRIMQNVRQIKKQIESGEHLHLDDYHKSMAEQINNDFDSLYPTLIRYYSNSLESQEQMTSIMLLRNKYYLENGNMLYENIASYGKLTISGFWYKLNKLLYSSLAA